MSRNANQIVRQWRALRVLESTRVGVTVQELHDAIEADCDPRTLYRPRRRSVDVTMELAGLPELAAWVAGYCGEVLPISPPHFRDLVRARFTAGLERLDAAPDARV